MHTEIYTNTDIRSHIQTHIYIGIHSYIYTDIHRNIHSYIHIQKEIHSYTHIVTHILCTYIHRHTLMAKNGLTHSCRRGTSKGKLILTREVTAGYLPKSLPHPVLYTHCTLGCVRVRKWHPLRAKWSRVPVPALPFV